MNFDRNKNELILKGIVKSLPKKLFGDCDKYEFEMSVKRFSGNEDVVKIIYDNSSVLSGNAEQLIKVGNFVSVSGKIMSYHTYEAQCEKRHLNMRAYASIISSDKSEDNVNEVKFNGFIKSKPNRRITPKGRTICDFIVRIGKGENTNFIVCMAWGKTADMLAKCEIGDPISIDGRFQSRMYNKVIDEETIEIKTAYEVSVNTCSVLAA